MHLPPVPDSYWVVPGKLLAGEHGLHPYRALLQEEARALGRVIEHHRMPIRDLSTPTQAQMARTLHAIDAALAAGHA